MDIEKINVGGTQYDVCDTVARAALSDEFSTGGTYAVGDYCIYENTLYKFTAAKEPGAWDASKVAATQIGDELSQLNGKMSSIRLPMGTIGAGEYIIDTVRNQVSNGIYLFYTQNAEDSHQSGDVSFTLVNRAAANYIYLYQFEYDNIYYAAIGTSTQSISWTQML